MFRSPSPTAQDTLLVVARVLFAAIFLFSGFGKIFGFNSSAHLLLESGVTFYPGIFVLLGIIFELGGGFSILLGWYTRIGAAALFVFTLLATAFVHHFWTYSPAVEEFQLIMLLKNMTILSGCIYIYCFGPGNRSLDARRGRI